MLIVDGSMSSTVSTWKFLWMLPLLLCMNSEYLLKLL